ncbi:FERM domain-containing protein 4A-like isoform X4 [Acanthaster planci]|uniref:FERM domain-containing protein 4A-like isoform X4 n=1 Tax=Acanthaster planci TaxID=133434 RepID=A0A8B7Z431_ACAPL|nr:FERM domain-containing protein 4A-like isoform X4 [Acanthaster planci]
MEHDMLGPLLNVHMTDGRRTQVVLLDDKRVDLVVQSKLLAGDLLDLVVSYFSLKEKEYFGLACADEIGHYNWLQLDRKVLDHEFLPRTGTLILYFQVQFFCESIAHLRDSITIELFYLQAKNSIFKGDIEVDSETVFELAAYVLQATDGDFISDAKARNDLKTLPVLPHSTLREHPSLPYCEEKIIFYYRQLKGLSRGQAIICYMQLVESLPTYGVHFYELKDKTGIPWWLGLSYKGIGQYDIKDRLTPRKVFQWRQLQNIYYRDRKFYIEVIDPRRVVHTLSNLNLYEESLEEDIYDELSDAIADPTTQVSVSKRTFGAANSTIHAWYGSPVMVKSMWTMAVRQHQFYLDKKHSKERYPAQRSFNQIANELTTSTNSLTPSQTSEMSEEQTEGEGTNITLLKDAKEASSRELLAIEGEVARKELVEALKARKVVLQDTLQEKLENLRQLCLKEAEITGELPIEYPRIPGEPLPRPKTRVTTAFTLSDKTVNTPESHEEDEGLSRLEGEYEIQSKITTAAMKLANDPTISKKVRKTRRDSYKKSAQRLNSIEVQLIDLRRKLGLELAEPSPEKRALEEYNSMNRSGRKASTPHTPPTSRLGFGFMSERGRTKTLDDKKGARIRSKSVPRQLLNGGWRSPSQSRKSKDKGQTPVEIYSDTPPKDSPKAYKKSDSKKSSRVKKPPVSSYQSETNLQTSSDLMNGPRQIRSNSMSSKDSYHSHRSVDYVENQRQPSYAKTPVGYSDTFSKSTPTLNLQGETSGADSPRRHRNPSNSGSSGSSSARGPPPSYHNSTACRSLNRTGRYYESPELSSSRRDYDSPRLGHHAASLHDLQLSSAHRELPEFDDDLEYHQQPTSLSQPASPKKHHSLGNLNLKSGSVPGPQDIEEQNSAAYTPYRSRTQYRSQQYQNYASRLQGPKKFEFEEVNNYINQPYDPQMDQHDPQQNQSVYHDQVDFTIDQPVPSDRGSGHSSLVGDFQPGATRNRHHSISSQQSSSSHSSHSSSMAIQLGPGSGGSPYHSQRTPVYTHVSEYTSSYASISHTPSNINVSSHNMSAHSQSMTLYQEPQPADTYRTEPKPAAVYRTTSSMVLRPQQTFGTGIAVSKVHYQPVTPMTCEPVALHKKPTHSASTNSLPSFTALEGRSHMVRLHEERPPSYQKPFQVRMKIRCTDLGQGATTVTAQGFHVTLSPHH